MNFANVTDWRIPEGDVIRVVDNNGVQIWPTVLTPPDNNYFWIKNISNNTVRITVAESYQHIFSSSDTTNWNWWNSRNNVAYLDIEPGTYRYVCADFLLYNSPILTTTNVPALKIGGDLSKIYYIPSTGRTLNVEPHYYQSIFNGNTALYDASELTVTIRDTLKDTTSSSISYTDNENLYAYCCVNLFKNCNNLVYPPNEMKIPCFTWQGSSGYSTTCYVRVYVQSWQSAFENCVSLIKTPLIKLNVPKVSWKYTTTISGHQTTITGNEELTNNYITGRQTLWSAFEGCTSLSEAHYACGDNYSNFTQKINGTNYSISWYDVNSVQGLDYSTDSMVYNTSNQVTAYIPSGKSSKFSTNMIRTGWTVIEQ